MSDQTATSPPQGRQKPGAADLDGIVSRHPTEPAGVIPFLQDVQEHLGYVPAEAIDRFSRRSGISANEIYGVATFYAQFRFVPPGEHTIRLCQGTACHVRGSSEILDEIEQQLDVGAGQTTADGKFDVERVACVGCCALAPVVVVDGDVHARMSRGKVSPMLGEYDRRDSTES